MKDEKISIKRHHSPRGLDSGNPPISSDEQGYSFVHLQNNPGNAPLPSLLSRFFPSLTCESLPFVYSVLSLLPDRLGVVSFVLVL